MFSNLERQRMMGVAPGIDINEIILMFRGAINEINTLQRIVNDLRDSQPKQEPPKEEPEEPEEADVQPSLSPPPPKAHKKVVKKRKR